MSAVFGCGGVWIANLGILFGMTRARQGVYDMR